MSKTKKSSAGKIVRNILIVLCIVAFAVVDVVMIYPYLHTTAVAEQPTVKATQMATKTGWVSADGRSFYYNEQGQRAAGLAEVEGKTYYFDKRVGTLKTGWVNDNGQSYYCNEDGTIATGPVTVGEDHYYFNDQGLMVTGWVDLNGERYYYGADGKQYFGRHEIDGENYWFNATTGAYTELNIDPDKPMIALTWDDGPSVSTDLVLDALESVGGRGTFFVVGQRLEYYEAAVKRAVDMGCEIGNHTWNHYYLDTLDAAGIIDQLTRTNDAVEQLTGVRPTIMRPTGGRVNDTVRANVGMPMFYWSVDTMDWKTKDTQATINSVLSNAYDGAIILMHDLHAPTGAAAQTICTELTNRGYQLVTLSELAAARGITLEDGVLYFDMKPEVKTETTAEVETEAETVAPETAAPEAAAAETTAITEPTLVTPAESETAGAI